MEEGEESDIYRPQQLEYSSENKLFQEPPNNLPQTETLTDIETLTLTEIETLAEIDDSHLSREEMSDVYMPREIEHSNEDKLSQPQTLKEMIETLTEIDDSQLVGSREEISDVYTSKQFEHSSEDKLLKVEEPPIIPQLETLAEIETLTEIDDSQLVGFREEISDVCRPQQIENSSQDKLLEAEESISLPQTETLKEIETLTEIDDSQLVVSREDQQFEHLSEDKLLESEEPPPLPQSETLKEILDLPQPETLTEIDDSQLVSSREETSDVYRPQQFEHSSEVKLLLVEEPPTLPQLETLTEIDDSQLLGSPPPVAADVDAVLEEEESMAAMEVDEEVVESSRRGGGRKKRGRPARLQMKTPVKTPVRKLVGDDVCFICFDGGNLVLCDRRGCPKAYHPSCVNRDEAFFQSRGRWNCGWHICSNCEKPAQHMCYTCTYSLCKGCIKEAVFFKVRGNKGLCETCMGIVTLIEKNGEADQEMARIDFDDKSNWEYLFKEYWLELKGKLSLTSEELTRAINPRKGPGGLPRNEESSDELYDANNDPGSSSDISSGNLEVGNSARKKGTKRSKSSTIEEDSPSAIKSSGTGGKSVVQDTEWASKELLEFVAHMKDGDKSVLSQFDVQALLLEYIKLKNLRDPRRKSQIICDPRLENLFGKPRVGHFEMLKLLESHFLIKEPPPTFADDSLDTEVLHTEVEGNSDAITKTGSDKKKKTRKRNERGPQTNLDDYAAIDVHNINLIYLRRNLMEDLIEDMDRFQNKVIGSFVRIRISGAGQKQDMYRLVQVVGTGKAAEPYKTGKRTTDATLEILNLNKTEVITIDTISNQEFSEEECKRLRQSIKCGLISRLTVGEVYEKARVLQAVRVNDWLETELLRLSHLRDRASETGRRKELRECVEKLQLLNTPEERSRRLHELPEVHADPNMDPSHESDEEEVDPDDKKRDNYMRPRHAGFYRKGREPISPGKGGLTSNDVWDGGRRISTDNWESSRNMPTKGIDKGDGASERANEPSWNQGRDVHQTNSWETPKNQAITASSEGGAWNSQPVSGSVLPEKVDETDKVWNYQDPSGKIQGPFSMKQLRKWSTTGYFPANLRIWKASATQNDSLLLTDALSGKFDELGTQLGVNNSWGSSTPEVVNPKDGLSGNSSRGWDASKGSNAWPGQPQSNSPRPGTSFSGKPYQMPSHQGREARGGRNASHQGNEGPGRGNAGRLNPSQNHGNTWNTGRSPGFQSGSHGYEKPSEGWTAQLENNSSKDLGRPSSVAPPKLATGGWGPEQGSKNDFSSLPTPTPKSSSGGFTGVQDAENTWSPTPAVSSQPTSSVWSPTPNQGGNGTQQTPMVTDPNQIAAGWVNQPPPPLPTPSAGSWGPPINDFSSPPSPTPNPSSVVTRSGWDVGQGVALSLQGTQQVPSQIIATDQLPLVPHRDILEPEKNLASTNASTPATIAMSDSRAPVPPSDGFQASWQAMSDVSTEKGLISTVQPLVPLKTVGTVQTTFQNEVPLPASMDVRSINPVTISSQESQVASHGWGPAQNIQPPGSIPKPGDAGVGWGLNPSQIPQPVPAPANWAGQPNAMGPNWSTPLAAPTTNSLNTGWGPAPENSNKGWGPPEGSANPSWGPATQQNTNMGYGEAPQGNTNPGWGAGSQVNTNMWGSQHKYNGGRGQGDRGFHGNNSGQSGGRSQWNRSSSFGGGGSSGPAVCKYHESGRCRKGTSCNYLHT
ncbi:uncharacterized protein LOC143854114 [Tasmannia lanceolata]|uniref:uncharacterized protein LOC143854114 n=1 Tax=Tasmannia lanceolata TaxID=3420 RepID=UPI004063C4CF